jgi:hypothetical protein
VQRFHEVRKKGKKKKRTAKKDSKKGEKKKNEKGKEKGCAEIWQMPDKNVIRIHFLNNYIAHPRV